MRPASALLLLATLMHGQSAPPNAIKLTKYVLGVADLDRCYAFYHALGLDLEKEAPLPKPNVLPEVLLKLVDVPPGTKFRNMMLKVPNTPFALEVTEFSGLDLKPVKPRIQDPGASILTLTMDDVDAALANAKKFGGEVVALGGSGQTASVTLHDPDGYYLQLSPAGKKPSGTGKVVGASFASVVKDAEKASAFYRNKFGFSATSSTTWSPSQTAKLGIKGARLLSVAVSAAGSPVTWSFYEFKDVDRKPYTPRIPDPGAPAVGLQVHDMDASIEAVKAAGGMSITQGGSLKLGGNGKVGFVRDPNGILVELAQP